MNMTVPVTYGELRIEVGCYVEPPDPSVGITSPLIDIEELHTEHGVYVDDFVMDRYSKDQAFAMTMLDLTEKAIKQGQEDNKVEAQIALRPDLNPSCFRVCPDRIRRTA